MESFVRRIVNEMLSLNNDKQIKVIGTDNAEYANVVLIDTEPIEKSYTYNVYIGDELKYERYVKIIRSDSQKIIGVGFDNHIFNSRKDVVDFVKQIKGLRIENLEIIINNINIKWENFK